MADGETVKAITGIGGVIAFLAIAASCGYYNDHHKDDPPPPPSQEDIQASVIATCESAVKKGLKDPGSAQFGDSWRAWEITAPDSPPPADLDFKPWEGEKYWNAGGPVNAKNSYGGYVGDENYVCDAAVAKNGDVHVIARPMSDLLPPT